MREAISGNQWHPSAIRCNWELSRNHSGNQWQSVAISGNQWQSVTLGGMAFTCLYDERKPVSAGVSSHRCVS